MTPRQAAIHAHFLGRDEAIKDARMFTVMRLALGGDEKTVDAWLADLDLK